MRILILTIVFTMGFLSLAGCEDDAGEESDSGTDAEKKNVGICEGDGPAPVRPEGWGLKSHCNHVAPDYEKLFGDDVVHRFDITISPDNYQATMDDLDAKLSGGNPDEEVETPIFVPVTVEFDGLTWWYVGMRYKGNASLKNAWQRSVRKIAIRLNFDMFGTEEEHLEVRNQRFFGFQKLTFSNAFDDPSLIRDKLAADVFREGGVPTARAAFARIYMDHGQGSVYLGLYTMIEDPSDQMPNDQFGEGRGNMYKPEGPGAMWGEFDPIDFPKRTNPYADWSDVKAAFAALHADRSDPQQWRENLEACFNVRSFLKYLAINQAMQNWDSYGFMPHNYYIYGVPDDGGRLFWFPWDFNLSMMEKTVDGKDSGSVMLDEIGEEWPLIRFLLDDAEYRATYRSELQEVVEGAFSVEKMNDRIDAYHDLIAPYVVGPEERESEPYTFLDGENDFKESLETGGNALKPHVLARHAAVQRALED
ncbi:MAG: CotH kinase family protein [Deltaproteobacteria bacterium]|nr:CotH kinase family protein [Deltaproteobacteria bacterium]